MNRNFFILLSFLFVLLLHSPAFCQQYSDTTKVYRVETLDGNTFTGKIISEDAINLVIKTEKLGTLNFLKPDIKSITELLESNKVQGEYWLPNPQSSRYFWAPNGYGLKKGEAYYQNIWILYNQVSVGLTKNFSIGAGMVPLFLIQGASTPVWIVPKFSIPVVENKFNIGTGAFLGTVIGEDTGIYGLLYGTATLGTRDKNLSIGLAYGFLQDEWAEIPVVNIGGLLRIGPKGYLISENYVITADGEVIALMSAGGRSIVRNIGIDYSLWIPMGAGIEKLTAIPFLGITVPIGKVR